MKHPPGYGLVEHSRTDRFSNGNHCRRFFYFRRIYGAVLGAEAGEAAEEVAGAALWVAGI